MNNGAIAYQLPTFVGCLNHGLDNTKFVRDMGDNQQTYVDCRIEAQVKSGDYFVTLATILDSLALKSNDYSTQRALEDAVSDLIYMQDNYVIKSSRDD
jgi:hypothetical protein